MRISSIFTLTLSLCALSATANAQQNIIPKPTVVKVEKDGKAFCIQPNSRIIAIVEKGSAEAQAAEDFAQLLRVGTGLELPLICHEPTETVEDLGTGEIYIIFNKSLKNKGEEAYTIMANDAANPYKEDLVIDFASAAGIMRAYASIAQMLPPVFFSTDAALKASTTWTLGESAFTLEDAPRFKWRAFMLDEARHFYGVKEVKRILDTMALLKMNILHWHLTDNDGWRIEIKKYPRLTEIGSSRADSEAIKWRSGKSLGRPHSGFYTQEQIKDIVAYAAERGITIIPEFDVPGHSSAASVAYPWLSLKPLEEMPTKFGSNAALDPTKESTYEFVSDVFDELITLFPSPILHFGGDEVRFSKQWEGVPEIEAFMKEHGYTSLAQVQMHFTNRVEQLIRDKGKRAMGWNEIMGGDIHGDGGGDVVSKIHPNTIIHYWAGPKSHIKKAVSKGHELVNSSHEDTYLDYSYDRIPLEKSYSFDPRAGDFTPEEAQRIIGLGTQMWTEWTPTVADMHRQAFPRAIAYAEVGWTKKENKDYQDFLRRLAELKKRLDLIGVDYKK